MSSTWSATSTLKRMRIAEAQRDMRDAYYGGATGLFVSGTAWLAAGLVAVLVSPRASVYTLFFAGMAIFPVSVLLDKLLGRSGKHAPENALGTAAGEGTVIFILAIIIAVALSLYRIEWFFPAMLLLIGARYLTFQTFYGMRSYWLCGAVLMASGLALGALAAPPAWGAFAGALIEYGFGFVIFAQIRAESSGDSSAGNI